MAKGGRTHKSKYAPGGNMMNELMGVGGEMGPSQSKSKTLDKQLEKDVIEAEAVSTQCAQECNHGMMVELMKKAMFKIANSEKSQAK